MSSKEEEKYLASIYYNPKHPGSFCGPTKLFNVVKREGKHNLGMSQIKKWLAAQDTYTLHRSARKKIKRNKVIVDGIDDQWDMDLMDMTQLAKENDGVQYVLLAVDIFSRFVKVQPLKTKQGKEVVEALKIMFKDGRIPAKCRTDKGSEFVNRWVKSYLNEMKVNHFVTHNEVKASYAERAIKTIKGKIFKYFTQKETYRYIDKLQDFVYGYNHTVHRTIKMTPAEVTPEIQVALWKQQYYTPPPPPSKKKKKKRKRPFKYKIDDTVRVSFLRGTFDREYHQKWSGEVFFVTQRFLRKGIPVYRVKDYAGDAVQGTFYESELQKIVFDKDQSFKIEKVLKTKGKGKNKQYFVRWQNWPPKYDSWVSSVTDI